MILNTVQLAQILGYGVMFGGSGGLIAFVEIVSMLGSVCRGDFAGGFLLEVWRGEMWDGSIWIEASFRIEYGHSCVKSANEWFKG